MATMMCMFYHYDLIFLYVRARVHFRLKDGLQPQIRGKRD